MERVMKEVPPGYYYESADQIGPSIYVRFTDGKDFLEIPAKAIA